MVKPTILVTGATGKTGSPVVLQLLENGYPVRAFVHQKDLRSERLRQAGAEIAAGTLEDYEDLENAMRGVARAYFCPPLEPGTLRRATLFAAAAREARLEVVVHLSQWLADPLHPASHAREKWLSNQIMSAMPGIGTVTVQPGWFADNYFAVLGQAAQLGIFGLPLGEGLNAPPSNEDIARVIVACLINPEPHLGRAYRPTGPSLLSPSDIARIIGKALGRKVRYQDVPLPIFLKAAASLGLSPFVISQLYWFLQDYQRGAFGIGAPTGAVEEVAGTAPEDFETIAMRYTAASPSAKRTLTGWLREANALAAALATRRPDIDAIDMGFALPRPGNFKLAIDSPLWQSMRK
jgi:NAD(P)H dehydrogenase (quinone)